MNCPACRYENAPESAFCEECGTRLDQRCPVCGSGCAPTAKFCRSCGIPLVARPAEKTEARKVVTIIFADLIGSTSLHERLDAESTRRLMDRYYRALRVAVETHGGTVVKLLGDGVIAAFGVPRVAEDDAIRAVRAAVAMQHAFRELARAQADAVGDLGLRVGVNTGEVVVSEGNDDVVGDPVNVAARLQQEARDGDVLIGESTCRLVSELVTLAPFGVLSLKGRAETVAAYRVVSLDRPAGAAATAFVGRDDELRRIMAVYDAAVTERRARLAVILGSPGLGKSRLLDEVGRRLGDSAKVLTAHCESAGGATFAPIAKAVRTWLGVGQADRTDPPDPSDPALIAALLASASASPEETFFVIRRFLTALATTRPVVLAIDDLQWAEPLLLDLIEHLIQWSKDVPLLVLAAARPELRDARSSLASSGGLVSEVVTLAGLDAAAATRLAANVIGADALPAAVAGRVLATSEGNPLFVGELVRMLVNDGALKREGDRWTAAVDLAAHDMPPTIHALLAARIERLRPEDRAVLERAAVVGRQFSRSAVAHLLPREITDLDARLESLRRSEVIEPDASWFLGEPALRFHHGLTRDAAYRRVLKGTRAELHARLADWIESRVGDAIEHDETLGWHLEQAHQHLRELGPIDAHGRALGERAARYLAAAGRRALARDDVAPAANLLGRGLHLLDESDPARADLALDWCEALLSAGDVGPAAKAIAELGRFITRPTPDPTPQPLIPNPRLAAWHTCFVGQLAVLTDPQSLHATAAAVATAAEELASAGDTAGEAKAHSVHAAALQRLGKIGACEAALDKALTAARRADDRRRSNAVLAGAPLAALWGPSPVTRASGRCLDVVRVLRITQGAPAVEAVALRCQAVLEALRGRTAAARRMIASSRRMVEELGIMQGLLETEMFAGLIELIEGDTAAAELSLRAAYDGLRDHGLGIDAARAAALLGITLLAQGRAAEAEALSHESETLAGDDLQAAITWRRVRAEALARRGEHATAVDFARAAADIAAATDALLHHADARMALAAALRAAGGRDADGAAAEEARAIELWEAKGATVLAERARRAEGTTASQLSADASVRSPLPPGEGQGEGKEYATPRGQFPHPSPLPKGEGVERTHRRVRPNAATANAARMDAAIAARNADAFPALLAAGARYVHHPTDRVYGREAWLDELRSIPAIDALRYAHEPLATLGDWLGLCRRCASFPEAGDFGPTEMEAIILIEVDAEGGRVCTEVFATNRLGDAVARLYERYADLLPEGPERARAAATARSVATMGDADRWATALGSGELVDHRTVGIGSVRGAEGIQRVVGSLREVADDLAVRVDDILSLQSDAYLVAWTNFGTDRTGGGAFERNFLLFCVYGADGQPTHTEVFDIGHDAEALARFDELTGDPYPFRHSREGGNPSELLDARLRGHDEHMHGMAHRVRRRVRPNAATANAARLGALIAARDSDALPTVFADRFDLLDHPNGIEYDRQASLTSWRLLLRAQEPTYWQEPLATLGESLALYRESWSGSGDGELDAGAFERERIVLLEVDAQGRRQRAEVFAADRLGHAIARLYERYADLLPDGAARASAAATAHTVATIGDADRWASVIWSVAEFVDHRTVGIGAVQGAEAMLRVIGSLREAADDLIIRVDDILSLRSDAYLVAWTNFGTDRTGGGAFERNFLLFCVHGADGQPTHAEIFDIDHDDEALARFDELTDQRRHARSLQAGIQEGGVDSHQEIAGMTEGHPSISPLAKGRTKEGSPARTARRVRPNAATAHVAHLNAAVAARDADALPLLLADDAEVVHHATGATYGRSGTLDFYRRQFRTTEDLAARQEPLATLGDSLALCRLSVSGSGATGRTFDVGAFDFDNVTLVEVDAQGRRRRLEIFADDHLGDAVVRLYERYAELLPDGPERTRAAATARSVAAMLDPPDVDRYGAALAPAAEYVDHRTLGHGSVRGAEAILRGVGAWLEVAENLTRRIEEIVDLRSGYLLVRRTSFGTDRAGGGAYERPFLLLLVFGADGRVSRWEQFDVDHDAEALARFDELTAEPSAVRVAAAPSRVAGQRGRRVRANAASAAMARLEDVFAARDLGAVDALLADTIETVDHPEGATYGREGTLDSVTRMLRSRDLEFRLETLATLGELLCLSRRRVTASGIAGGRFDVAEYETEHIVIAEVDERGRFQRYEVFAADRLGDAIARLYERYAELLPNGSARLRAAETARSATTMQDADCWGSALRGSVEFVDHRIVGIGSLRGTEAIPRVIASLREVADDLTTRVDDILGLKSDAFLAAWTNFGTDRTSGGAFERNFLLLCVYGTDGLPVRVELFDVDHHGEAFARFDELTDQLRHARSLQAGIQEGGVDSRQEIAGMTEGHASISPLAKGRTKGRSPARTARRVRPNAATANAARLEAVLVARDADALLPLFAEDMEAVHHPTGATYDRQRALAETRRSLPSYENLTFTHEHLATLGESLALCRLSVSASGVADGDFDVGAYETEEVTLIEVDAQGRRRWVEIFAEDRLGDAIARLYERYAELLPDGPARARAAATAHTVATIGDADRWASVIWSVAEFVDHRTVGIGAVRGAEAMLRVIGSLREAADDLTTRVDDILSLRSDAYLVAWTTFGTDRTSGGAFERNVLALCVFGTDGLPTRIELFDVGHDDEALARFDELTASFWSPLPLGEGEGKRYAVSRGYSPHPSPLPEGEGAERIRRRVRANAATAHAARIDSVIAARDTDALSTLFADFVETVHHPMGTTYGREGLLASWRSLLNARDPACRHTPLATLGDSLALCRLSLSASGFAGATFDVGAYEREEILLIEVDAQGQRQRSEVFAADRLIDAIVRLYGRYADLLPAGPARERAAATARSLAALLGPFDPERYATAYAPAIETVDHRTLGTWSARGAQAVLQHFRSLLDVAADVDMRHNAILDLRSDAFFVHQTHTGTGRAGGGVYEREFLQILMFGTDGLLTRMEMFDSDRLGEALARFDELVLNLEGAAEPVLSGVEGSAPGEAGRSGSGRDEARPSSSGPRIENAATRAAASMTAAWEARDWERLAALLSAGFRNIDRRKMVQVELDREQFLEGCRSFLEMASSVGTNEVLATRGNRLALLRTEWKGADRDVGPSEVDLVDLLEVNAAGEQIASVFFDPDDLDAAYAELDARYAAGEAAPYARLWEMYPRNMRALAERDWEKFATAYAPDCVMEDHRPLGLPVLRSRDECVASARAFADIRPDATARVDHVLALDERRLLTVTGWVGSEPEGRFEIPVVVVVGRDLDGLVERADLYNLDQLDEARARYDGLLLEGAAEPVLSGVEGSAPGEGGRSGSGRDEARPSKTGEASSRDPLLIAPRFRNAATRSMHEFKDALEARDWERVAAVLAPEFRYFDRRTMMHLDLDRDQYLEFLRPNWQMSSAGLTQEFLATRGNRLALIRSLFEGSDHSVGPSEIEGLCVGEVNDHGVRVASVMFDPDDLDAAYAELDARYAAGEGAPYARASETLRTYARAGAARDWESMASVFDPDLVFEDHRLIGWGTFHSRDEYAARIRALVDLAPDVTVRVDHVLAFDHRGVLSVGRWEGSREGGPFEIPFVAVTVLGPDGHIQRIHTYNLEQLEEARARFAELRPDPLRIPPNAASRVLERWQRLALAGDWPGCGALASANFVYEDRRRYALVTGDVETWIKSMQEAADLLGPFSGIQSARTVIATVGDRILIEHEKWTRDPNAGAFEIELIRMTEVDADGRLAAWLNFDVDDRRAAFTEAEERFAAGEATGVAGQTPIAAMVRAYNEHDWPSMLATLANDFVLDDHRLIGFGTLSRDEWIESIRVHADLAPDVGAEGLRLLAWNRHGRVAVWRVFGTVRDGGPFENVFIGVYLIAGDSIQRYELFDITVVDRALARFAELCAERA
jgi:class 3 adenylate cyclase